MPLRQVHHLGDPFCVHPLYWPARPSHLIVRTCERPSNNASSRCAITASHAEQRLDDHTCTCRRERNPFSSPQSASYTDHQESLAPYIVKTATTSASISAQSVARDRPPQSVAWARLEDALADHPPQSVAGAALKSGRPPASCVATGSGHSSRRSRIVGNSRRVRLQILRIPEFLEEAMNS